MKNIISYLRKNRKMTQEELAIKAGVSRQTIISLESGKSTASLDLAYKIAQVFNLAIEEVFIFKDKL